MFAATQLDCAPIRLLYVDLFQPINFHPQHLTFYRSLCLIIITPFMSGSYEPLIIVKISCIKRTLVIIFWLLKQFSQFWKGEISPSNSNADGSNSYLRQKNKLQKLKQWRNEDFYRE